MPQFKMLTEDKPAGELGPDYQSSSCHWESPRQWQASKNPVPHREAGSVQREPRQYAPAAEFDQREPGDADRNITSDQNNIAKGRHAQAALLGSTFDFLTTYA